METELLVIIGAVVVLFPVLRKVAEWL